MKHHARSLSRLMSVFVLTLSAVSAQSTPPSGAFGFLINGSYSDPSTTTGFAILGVMNFDGAGKVTGSYTSEVGDGPKQSSKPITGPLTGTYSSNPDGAGSVTITLDMGTSFTFAMAITDGGQGLQLVATNCSGDCEIGGNTTISGVARAAYTGPPKGSYGFESSYSPKPAAGVGVMNFDGAGNVTQSFTGVFLSGTKGQPQIFISGTETGTYSINPDGSGTLDFPASANDNHQTYAFVITDGGAGAMLLQTNRAGNGVSFGTARLQ
jgi:hypothetical protein